MNGVNGVTPRIVIEVEGQGEWKDRKGRNGPKYKKDVPEGSQGSPPDKPEKPEKPDKPEKPEKPEKSTAATEDPQSSLTDGNASFLRAARAGNLDKVLDYLKGSTDINTSNANGLNALHLSSKEGHLNIVTELLKRGANVDAATKKGNTALHIASLAGQEAIVKVLVEYGANVNVQSQNGFTPLYMAAQENHVSVVKFLLSHGANQNLATEDGFTPLAVALQQGHDKVVAVLLENDRAGKTRLPALHIAARKDDTKAAALLLQNGHNPDVTSKSGFTPLHIAAHYGHVNVATLLLQRGASVDYAARNNITPLHVASKWGRVNMVNTLLDRGARIDAKTRDGLTPLHCSARSGHDQCVDQLLERGAPIAAKTKNGLAPLHMAAQGDHVDSARLLLYHKATVDDVTVDYLTPLHVAAHCGHHRVAKLLLDRKANPSARALNGFTPLHIACKKNRLKVIELLLKYGASIHATTESGLTPLHVAAFMGNLNITMFLLNHGAQVDEVNVRGETPMHLAARSNQIEIIKILIRNNATVDAKAHEKQTPLHIAARLGNVEIVTLLLENKANPDAQTRDLYTALHIAAREGKEDVAAVLLDHKASLAMKTKKEFTPLHVAAKHGRLGVAALLLRHLASPDATAQNGLTPLHIAAHYDNVEVAMLLLDQGASPHTAAQNGFTPLHIAAKKNQMDVATTLLEYGADPNAMTKHGISPVHLAAQEGHTDMLSLLLERGAKPDISARNGLTPLHLVAQEDQVNCAAILLKNGAEVDPQSKAGYTPLHVACHYGNHKTAAFLLNHGAVISAKTKHGLTPLHQAAQQGHAAVINQLLQKGADPNETANNGYTALGIAKRFGYISVVNTLTTVTTIETTTITSQPTEEKLKVQVPETMQVTFMTDSEDEGDDISMTGDQSLLTPQEIKTMGDDSMPVDNRKSWEENWLTSGDPNMSYYTGPGSLSGHYSGGYKGSMPGRYGNTLSPGNFSMGDSRVSTLSRDVPLDTAEESMVDGEMIIPTSQITVESAAPLMASTPARGPITTVDGRQVHPGDPYHDEDGKPVEGMVYGPDGKPVPANLDNVPLTTNIPIFAGFLISFMVDARGGTMRSCRLPGLRVVVPPQRASGPTRVTCRLIKRNKLATPPPLMENEALATRVIEVAPPNTQFLGGLGNKAVSYPPLNDGECLISRIVEMGPPGERFIRPVLIEVPHFASLRGKEREIVILRSENGEQWKEHALDAREDDVHKALEGYEGDVDNENEKVLAANKRICRILTKDFPQFFAVISRVRQETNTIGPSGGMLSSTVVPQVQAVFPEGTLQKKIKVGLQAQPVGNDVVKKVLGNRVMVSPIVTIEPRRRKFHKPITVTIPVPTAYNQGVINGYGGDTPTLRLLCSITGGTAPAQWEDITGTTPLTFVNDCVSFTTTVSARFWLMDCKEIDQASNFARDLYLELKAVPFMAKFVVFAKTHDPIESRVRVFCMTDDRQDKTLEQQEQFKEVARSKDVEVLDGRPVYIEMAGNLTPVQKSGDQLHINFFAFHENRLPFFVRVRDQSQEACGRLSFMREPKVHRGMPPQKPICNLNITMPHFVKIKKASESESETESSEEEEYRMEKGEREQFEQKEYKEKITEEETEPSNLNFASIKLRKKYNFLQDPSMSPTSAHMKAELRLMMIAEQIGSDWKALGRELDSSDKELDTIENENDNVSEQAFVMLHSWAERSGKEATSEKLSAALNKIGRNDVADNCLGPYIVMDVTQEPEEPEDEGEADSFFGGKLDKSEFDQFKKELDALSPKDEEHADITLDITGPAVEEESFQPQSYEETKTPSSPQKSMDPKDVAALADAMNELIDAQPMDTEEDEGEPMGGSEQPITEEDMVMEESAPPEESAVDLGKLDEEDEAVPEDSQEGEEKQDEEKEEEEEEEPNEYAGMERVDEDLHQPGNLAPVEHQKPSSFDPEDIAALTEAMNEYAEAHTPHSDTEDDAPPAPEAEPPIDEDNMIAVESAPPQPEGQLHELLPGEELPEDEVEEIVEEFEETLDDGTVRKVTRKRIIKRTYQMVEVDPNDPDAIPEGVEGDDVHRITVHKKITKRTLVKDGEEVDTTEDVQTNIEEDGEEIKDTSELREDLQHIVDSFLKDGERGDAAAGHDG